MKKHEKILTVASIVFLVVIAISQPSWLMTLTAGITNIFGG